MKLKLKTIHILFLLLFPLLPICANERIPVFRTINAANGLADNSAQIVTCTKTGRMIISTIGNLNFYNSITFTHIDTRQEFVYPLPLYRGGYKMYFDRFHHLWLKDSRSVTCVDLMMEQFIPDPETVVHEMGYEAQALDLFVDNTGCVWFLTEDGLYNVESKKTYPVLKDRNLQEVDVYNNLLLAFYDNGEETAINLETGQTAHRTKAYEWEDMQKYNQSAILLPYNDSYFVIRKGESEAVLLKLDMKTLQWTTIMRAPYLLNSLAVLGNTLYVASSYGYWAFGIEDGSQRHVEEFQLENGKTLRTDCNALVFDKQEGMWIATGERGVLYAPPAASPFLSYDNDTPKAKEYAQMMGNLTQNIREFNGKIANCMFTDSRDWRWFGTTTGLYLYKTPKSEPIVYNKKNGLLNNMVHSIVEDKKHNIWVSTSCGISCILFEGDKFSFINSFNQTDNVPIESFLNCKAMCLDDGRIIMQSIDHVVEFNPEGVRIVNDKKPVTMYPKLIQLYVNGNSVEPGEEVDGNVVIDRAITRVKDINLNAEQNTVSLTFSGLNYFRPLQTYYRVRVVGIDDEWKVYSRFNGSSQVDDKGMFHLPLIGLKPGDYHVEVQASIFPDVWKGTPYVWEIHVNQPWWQATGIYVVIVVLILMMMIVNFVLYNRNTRMRTRRNAEEGDIVRKMRAYVERCDNYDHEHLGPIEEELFMDVTEKDIKLTQEFIDLMLKFIPFAHENKDFSIRDICEIGNVDIVKLHDMLKDNVYKSPRDIVILTQIQKATELLKKTDKTVEEIATACGFSSVNYFMGRFFHEYKLTPREYRAEHASRGL